MTTTQPAIDSVFYPESDGQPMTESDATRDYLTYSVEVLRLYFQGRRNVYVSGNIFVYYEEGNPKAVVSPDVLVVFGVSNRNRRTYKSWQEKGKLPSFILEITSKTTRKQDEVEKPALYARLGVQEYFQYDPTGDYLNPQLKGSRLHNGVYQPLPLETGADGVSYIHSPVLGLDLQLQAANQTLEGVWLPRELRFYDPQSDLKLLNRRETEQVLEETGQALKEAAQARVQAEQARVQAEQAKETAQQERDQLQQKAEQLAARLRELGHDPDLQ